ncbi:MAG: [FeFe] hydrogenase H-cluster radical SAM maturase HydE [Lutibacter sp.]|uniref:[FeFe] hydrogenase H-cluster radical SAM maturase HydE n=1 Tax=Lutibacter sp. TaxID=1925666 RepID=UPI0017FD0946|nr:[FeFe] hydrogenase H-cluster radical SAM maturase HydE [Lutibacter sp.]MBT8318388.1 [FeFe] hydrogenase H-cluster radical SAM maturase HydE [Lutibacter sp.]NNJ59246.1 [FeFe] hydrogenase H-cluster radical SAM maturase HydE [Lutibacter sp.]
MSNFKDILNKDNLTKQDLVCMLNAEGKNRDLLHRKSKEITKKFTTNKVYLRGLIEYSNVCVKDCLYCGIRKSNTQQKRYTISDSEVLNCAQYALENNYGSIVLQAGERTDKPFISKITTLLNEINKLSKGKLGITISLGEQTLEVYKEWFDAGAHRYLLRIETSNSELYKNLHPKNRMHNFQHRIDALNNIRLAGFKLGTGVMIGLPNQTIENLADDLLFMKAMNVDMVGMGPYIEHQHTPLFNDKNLLASKQKRLALSYNMIACLRILMKDINIAATTALQAIDNFGREKAIKIGANVLMPNITPGSFRDNYKLYEDKPCTNENASDCNTCIDVRMNMIGSEVGYNEWGDSKHFFKNKKQLSSS